FFIISSIAVQTLGSGISNLLAVGTTFTGSGNLYCQWKLSPGIGNALCILFPIVNELRAERLAKSHDHLALMAHSQNSFNFPTTHKDQSSSSTHSQQSFPINNKNGGNQFGQYVRQVALNQQGYNAWKNGGIQGAQNVVQNVGVQNGGNQNGLVVVLGIANQSGTGNVVAARAEGTGNGNQARCYNYRGLGHITRNSTARPRRRDAAYLQTQLLIAQKEEAGIQLQAEELDFMVAAGDLEKIKEVNANCILMANLQHASISGTQLDKAPVYDTDVSAENDNHVTSIAQSMVQSGGTVETSSAPNEKTLYNGNLLLEEYDPPDVYDSEETLELAQEIREKMRFLKKEIKPVNYAKINHLSGVFVPQTTKSKEVLFLSNVSNMVTISKMIFIPNEDLSNETTPSVARNWSSSAHKEVHGIISYEIAPIINQVDARVQNFEIQFLHEAAKCVRDFTSLTKETDESLDKQKSLELKIERLSKASVGHDIMSIVQNGFVDVPSDLQTELDRTKEKLELCIIKMEKGYDVLWNNWYTKCEECKYDMISYDKAYNDMQQKVERLQAQLRDLKGKSSDTPSASNTLDPLNQKLESKIIELELQVVNYERCFKHMRTSSFSSTLCGSFWELYVFGNDHIAAILGYGDLKWGNITITRVYFIEGKIKRASHPPKPVPNSKQQLHLLHMDLCSPMRVASINGKRYVL
nr:Gag-Pol polyprotein [Tanacetum cinerariifolium]